MSTTEELIQRSRSGDQSAKEQLIVENAGLIWSVARRFFGRGVESDDLYQLGCLGFIKAVEGFDTGFGTQFSTYAVPKIAGEIRRYIRDDGAVKVSRGIKERATVIKAARMKLVQSLGCEPTIAQISELTGISPEDIAIAETATADVESINRDNGGEGFTLESVLTDTKSEDMLLEQMALRQAIDKLPERESMVIRYRYYHGLTQQSVARIMDVSQVQISRIEKKALQKLRDLLS
jgi:RNA polymerase sporulation-specific sigma factor